MKITMRVGDHIVAGELYDNPVADQIAELLPLDAAFDDFHDQEKLTRLPRALDISGVPRADEPQAGEIGYYAPGTSLVLYYANPGRWPGLVRIGRFDQSPDRLRALPDGTRIVISTDEKATTRRTR
ncbi:cyclophilin-like fold protein [Arthrobacter sp. 135MFCol5.1]|uniref:cyclophilin-like fold protein n=1 Tax=Arthrobacter sp. 135MFCol5.1 TaxID=1158050 RepID=UPI000378021C|nr:cyclophilin-like fold protein [Arthrobacter sp. 135MFCol5.1]